MKSTIKYVGAILSRNMRKPLKIDIRTPCEQHATGPITRTFDISRKELITLLKKNNRNENNDIIDRIEIIEYSDEERITIYNPSQIEKPIIYDIKKQSTHEEIWDLESQYGDRFFVNKDI